MRWWFMTRGGIPGIPHWRFGLVSVEPCPHKPDAPALKWRLSALRPSPALFATPSHSEPERLILSAQAVRPGDAPSEPTCRPCKGRSAGVAFHSTTPTNTSPRHHARFARRLMNDPYRVDDLVCFVWLPRP